MRTIDKKKTRMQAKYNLNESYLILLKKKFLVSMQFINIEQLASRIARTERFRM